MSVSSDGSLIICLWLFFLDKKQQQCIDITLFKVADLLLYV